METAHIYIYGDIGCYQDSFSAEWGEITLTNVRQQYEAQKDAESITLHIHSPGGYVSEGFAIHDYVRSLGKPVTTIIEGMCYSIATVIALAGDTRKMTSNADFMIHNPWGGAMGDSSEIQRYADDLKKEENRIAEFYAKKTNISTEQALELMKAETFMSAEQALQNGFITEIAAVMKAVAKFNPEKPKMSKENNLTKDEALGMFAKLEEKLKNIFTKQSQAKLVQDANGAEIDFPELEADDTPAIGDKATIDGSPAEGERVMPSGETYVFTAGELTEIKPAEEAEEDVEALKAERDALKEQLEAQNLKATEAQAEAQALKTELDANQEGLKEIQKEIKALKSSIGSDFNHDSDKENFEEPKATKRKI